MMISQMISQFKIVVIIALTTTLSFAIIGNYYDDIVYGQIIDSDNNSDNIIKLEDIPTKHVKVGDIDISYKTFGKGDPVLLIIHVERSL